MKCGNCHEHHDTTNDVRACYAGDDEQVVAPTSGEDIARRWGVGSTHNVPRPRRNVGYGNASSLRDWDATEPQLRFVMRLLNERDATALTGDVLLLANDAAAEKPLTSGQASALIDALQAAPLQSRSEGPATEGLYKKDGVVYKVQAAKNGSGRLYAKRLVQNDAGTWSFEYAKGMVYKLRLEDALSEEEASEFGKLYGICVNCNKDLTRENSIHVGYGPYCAANLGWYYPTDAELRELQATAERQMT